MLCSVRKKKINKSFYFMLQRVYFIFWELKCDTDMTDDNFILVFELLIFYCFNRNLTIANLSIFKSRVKKN